MTQTRATTFAAKATTALIIAALAMFGTPATAVAEPTADGAFSGTVTEPTGEPAAGLVPTIYRLNWQGRLELVEALGESHDAGAYTVSGLPAGDYFAVVPGDGPEVGADLQPGAAPTWYGGTTLPGDATPIHVAEGRTVAGIDVTRVAAGIVTGQLTTIDGPLDGALVTAGAGTIGDANVGWANRNLESFTFTDSAGRFALAISPRVDYSLSFSKGGGTAISESWDDVPNGQGLPTTKINLEPGEVRHGIDAELAKPAAITGIVRDAAGTPIADVDIITYEVFEDGRAPVYLTYRRTMSGPDGRFEISPLSPGKYALWFYAEWPLIKEWWRDQPDLASATPISLGSGERFDAQVQLETPPLTPSAEPTISGSAVVGSTLTAVTDGWHDGAAFTYEWLADGERIWGYTDRTLQLYNGYEGKAISVTVIGAASGHLGVRRTSAATSRVMKWGTPTIGGWDWVGGTLAAKPGTWSEGTAFTYQWYADGSPIEGATASLLDLPSTLAGKKISVQVTGTRDGYTTHSATSAPTRGVGMTSKPTISGIPYVGETLTASPGQWTPGTSFTYTWRADGATIPGATGPSFTLPSSVENRAISVIVEGKLDGYGSQIEVSDPTRSVAASATPVISGTPYVGAEVTALPGSWTSETRFSYQWYANGAAIPEATQSTYVIGPSLVGTRLSVKITGAQSGYPAMSRTSTVTAPVTFEFNARLAGVDRYFTSTAISRYAFERGVPVVYLASGGSFPDALSGAPVAGVAGGPVILTQQAYLQYMTIEELVRLKPQRIVALGGTGVISDSQLSALKDYTAGTVARIAGTDRFATSAAISATSFPAGVPVAYIANGFTFPDALSGAPVAGMQGGPVLLTQAGSIPAPLANELKRLKPKRIVVLGGTGAISTALMSSLDAYTSGSVTRLAGADRFATSAAISKASFGAGVPVAYVANGLGFADALSGAPAAAVQGGPVLLVQKGSIPASVAAELKRLKPKRIAVLGGTGAVSDAVRAQLDAYVVP